MSAARRRALPLLGALAAAVLAGGLTTPPTPTVSAPGSPAVGDIIRFAEAADGVRVHRTYVVTGAAADHTVSVGGRIRIAGSAVTEPHHGRARARKVTVTERSNGRWTRAATAWTDRVGAWSVAIAAGTRLTTRTFRAEVSGGRGLRGGTSPTIQVRVVAPQAADPTTPAPEPTPAPAPTTGDTVDPAEALPAGYVGAGSASDWTYLLRGGSRWSPCGVIRWAYNPTGQGYDALADVQRAFAKIAGASGLRFRYVGTTPWVYLGDLSDASGFPAGTADIAVGWANAAALPTLAGSTVGYGGANGWTVSGADVRYRLQRGFLVLDNGHALASGFDRSGWGQIELHEILHALGLGHAASSDQLMYGTASSRNVAFGAGDLTGAGRIGAAAGCLS